MPRSRRCRAPTPVPVIDDCDIQNLEIRGVCHICRRERPPWRGSDAPDRADCCLRDGLYDACHRDTGGLRRPGCNVWRLAGFASSTIGARTKLICSTRPGFASLHEAAPHGVVVIRRGVLVHEQYFSGDSARSHWFRRVRNRRMHERLGLYIAAVTLEIVRAAPGRRGAGWVGTILGGYDASL